MKRLIVGAALIALAGGASADWESGVDGAVLKAGGAKFEVYLAAPGTRIMPFLSKQFLRVPDAAECINGLYPDTRGIKSNAYPSFFINGEKVVAAAVCSDKDLIVFPETEAGRRLLQSAIASNKAIKLQLNGGNAYTFDNRSGRQAISDIQNRSKGI